MPGAIADEGEDPASVGVCQRRCDVLDRLTPGIVGYASNVAC